MRSADLSLEIDGCDVTFDLIAVEGREAIHRPTRFVVAARPSDAEPFLAVIGDDLIGKVARLLLPLSSGAVRTVKLFVEEVEVARTAVRFVLAATIARAASAVDQKVFVDRRSVEIATTVLEAHGLTIENRCDRAPIKRPQCVQAFESDLAFVLRILAEDGISLVSAHDDADKIIFREAFENLPEMEPLIYRDEGGMAFGDAIHRVRVRSSLASDKAVVRGYDFEKPLVDQTSNATAGEVGLEVYRFHEGPVEAAEAPRLLAAIRRRRTVLEAEASVPGLVPGYVVELAQMPRPDLDGRYLVLDVEHTFQLGAASELPYQVRFTAIRADVEHRPEIPPEPVLGGIQSATITGSSGSEIHPDEHGRVRLHLRWDRELPLDDTASTWIRVVQPPTSGAMMLPRVGWETMVMFHGCSADRPYVLGRLYNAHAQPPGALPGKSTVSQFGTLTSPGGGSANMLLIDDAAGSESVAFTASKDMKEKTENDKIIGVTANDSHNISSDRKLIVGQVHEVKVGGAQTTSIGASKTTNVTANLSIVAASETVVIGGLRTFNVGGDYSVGCATKIRLVGGSKLETAIEHQTRLVTGASTVVIGGSWNVRAARAESLAVGGAATLAVSGAKSVTARSYTRKVRGVATETIGSRRIDSGADRVEKSGAALTYDVGGSGEIKGAKVVFEASSRITIKASGITITIDSSSVTVDGQFKNSGSSTDSGEESYD